LQRDQELRSWSERLEVGGPDRESHLFVSMIEDRTDQAGAAA
jgi:hypothetical protein